MQIYFICFLAYNFFNILFCVYEILFVSLYQQKEIIVITIKSNNYGKY